MDKKTNLRIITGLSLLSTINKDKSQPEILVKANRNFTTLRSPKQSTALLNVKSISIKKKISSTSKILKKLQDHNSHNYLNNENFKSCKKQLFSCKSTITKKYDKKEESAIKSEVERVLLKNSDSIIKLLWNDSDIRLPPLLISANFIMDEDMFWQSPSINTDINKTWKFLHHHYFVIWILALQKGFKKLKQYTERNCLPLNAVYYHNKKNRYTIDFTPIKRHINKIYGQYGQQLSQIKMIINLKLNLKDLYHYQSFFGKIPIMLDSRLKVFYIPTQYNGEGLEKIYDLCKNIHFNNNNKIVQLKSIKKYIRDYVIFKLKQLKENNKSTKVQSSNIDIRQENEHFNEIEAEKQVELFRKQIIENIIEQKGRNFQYEGLSIHYFVGDFIKRNYYLLIDSIMRRKKMFQTIKTSQADKEKQQQNINFEIMENYYQYYI